MKKIFIFIIIIFTCQQVVFSQETEKTKSFLANEIKLNLFNTIIFYYPELNYERILKEKFGIGMSAAVRFESDNRIFSFEDEHQWHIMPYGRYYLYYNKKQYAFFIEGHLSVLRNNFNYIDENLTIRKGNKINFGKGFAIGNKFFNVSNFVGEIFIGIGRTFGSEENDLTYPRAGISIGYRF